MKVKADLSGTSFWNEKNHSTVLSIFKGLSWVFDRVLTHSHVAKHPLVKAKQHFAIFANESQHRNCPQGKPKATSSAFSKTLSQRRMRNDISNNQSNQFVFYMSKKKTKEFTATS